MADAHASSKSVASPGAMVYAKALFDAVAAAGSDGDLRTVDERLQGIAAAWRSDSAFRGFFLSATVTAPERASALERLIASDPQLFQNFMRLLLKRGRLSLLDEIAVGFDALLDERLGRIPVTLTTAVPVAEHDFQSWTSQIRAAIGGEPVLEHVVDPDIVAGAIIRVGDRVIDGSARRSLAALRENIIQRGKQNHALQS